MRISALSVFGAVVLALAAISCGGPVTSPPPLPDLIVFSSEANTVGAEYAVSFTVKNIGTAASSGGRIYVNARNPQPPSGSDIRIQKEFPLGQIAAGAETDKFTVKFSTAQMNDVLVKQIQIDVDPKQEVREGNETNNVKEWSWP